MQAVSILPVRASAHYIQNSQCAIGQGDGIEAAPASSQAAAIGRAAGGHDQVAGIARSW